MNQENLSSDAHLYNKLKHFRSVYRFLKTVKLTLEAHFLIYFEKKVSFERSEKILLWFQNIISYALKMSLKKALLHIYGVWSIYNIVNVCIFWKNTDMLVQNIYGRKIVWKVTEQNNLQSQHLFRSLLLKNSLHWLFIFANPSFLSVFYPNPCKNSRKSNKQFIWAYRNGTCFEIDSEINLWLAKQTMSSLVSF